MSRGRWLAGNLAAMLSVAFAGSGDCDDPILKGGVTRFQPKALEGVRHLMICAPTDCPTCCEFLIAEIGRLMGDPGRCGRWALIVASEVESDTTFAQWIRDRYDPPVPLFAAGRKVLEALIPNGMPSTPCIVRRRDDGTLAETWTITPGVLDAAARFFDSLYVSGPGGRGP